MKYLDKLLKELEAKGYTLFAHNIILHSYMSQTDLSDKASYSRNRTQRFSSNIHVYTKVSIKNNVGKVIDNFTSEVAADFIVNQAENYSRESTSIEDGVTITRSLRLLRDNIFDQTTLLE